MCGLLIVTISLQLSGHQPPPLPYLVSIILRNKASKIRQIHFYWYRFTFVLIQSLLAVHCPLNTFLAHPYNSMRSIQSVMANRAYLLPTRSHRSDRNNMKRHNFLTKTLNSQVKHIIICSQNSPALYSYHLQTVTVWKSNASRHYACTNPLVSITTDSRQQTKGMHEKRPRTSGH